MNFLSEDTLEIDEPQENLAQNLVLVTPFPPRARMRAYEFFPHWEAQRRACAIFHRCRSCCKASRPQRQNKATRRPTDPSPERSIRRYREAEFLSRLPWNLSRHRCSCK